MAGKTGQFLSPAHFQVNPRNSLVKPKISEGDIKLLPPGRYEKVSEEANKEFESAKKEVVCLRDEVKVLRQHLETLKARDLESIGEIHKHRVRVQTSRISDDSLRRIAEVEEENTALHSETRKQQAVISKVRNDIKLIKVDYDGEIEKLDGEVAKYGPVIRKLKHEIKEKDVKYDSDVETLRKQLKKQICNVKELKSELQKTHEQVKMDRSGFENVISQRESQKYLDFKNLQESLKDCKARYMNDVKELSECIEGKQKIIDMVQKECTGKEMEIKELKGKTVRKENEFMDKMNQYKAQIDSSQEYFEATGNELRLALQEAVESHNRALEDFHKKLNAKDKQIKQEQNTIEQLRVYIGENLPNAQLDQLNNENERLKRNLETVMKENGTISSTIEFLKVRLSSLNEILNIQENELKKSLANGQNGADNLLTGWRKKVFALLVQLKSQEIGQENNINENKHILKKQQSALEMSQHDLDILSHTLADRNAELQIELNLTKSLKEELAEKKSTEDKLLSSLEENRNAVISLYENSFNMEPFLKGFCSKINEAFVKLGSFSQRVSFAAGRVQFLQGLFTQREARWKNELMVALKEEEKTIENEAIEYSDEKQFPSSEQLLNEISRLTQDRDMLAAQAIKDTELLDCRVANMKSEYKESALKIEQLHDELKDEKERYRALADKFEESRNVLTESNETVETLKSHVARLSSEAETKLEKALAEEKSKFTEEFAQLEKQLNDVRREHTKLAVALRQAEHQVSREKEKARAQLALQKKEHDHKFECLDKLTKSLEQERNMLLTTVRQEGFQVTRFLPKGTNFTSDDSDIDHGKENLLPAVKPPTRNKSNKMERSTNKLSILKRDSFHEREEIAPPDVEALTSALQELKSLSEALLKDDDEDI